MTLRRFFNFSFIVAVFLVRYLALNSKNEVRVYEDSSSLCDKRNTKRLRTNLIYINL